MAILEKQPKCYTELRAKINKDLLERIHYLNNLHAESSKEMQAMIEMEMDDIITLQKLLKKAN